MDAGESTLNALRLLTSCQETMLGEGRVICIDAMLPPMGNTGSAPSRMLDLEMLVAITGKERTEDQWRRLYEAAGLRISKITPLQDNFGASIVEGVKRE